MAFSQPDALIYPIANGNDQGLIWPFTPYQSPLFGIAVNEDSDIKDASQLENKTVGMTATGPPFETFMKVNVAEAGGDPSTIKVVAIGSAPAAVEALRNGEIDAFVNNKSATVLAAQATKTKTRFLDFPPEVADGFAAGFLMRKDADEKKRDMIARYLRALLKTAIYAQENPDKAVKLNWELYPASKPADKPEKEAVEEAKIALAEIVNYYKRSSDGVYGLISEERWQKFVEMNGLSSKIPDVTILYDHSLLVKINDFDEEALREKARND